MFTIRKPEKKIKLNKYLDSIGLDKPKIFVNTQIGKESISEYMGNLFSSKMKENGLSHIPLLTRNHSLLSYCSCNFEYSKLATFNNKEFKKRFALIKPESL